MYKKMIFFSLIILGISQISALDAMQCGSSKHIEQIRELSHEQIGDKIGKIVASVVKIVKSLPNDEKAHQKKVLNKVAAVLEMHAVCQNARPWIKHVAKKHDIDLAEQIAELKELLSDEGGLSEEDAIEAVYGLVEEYLENGILNDFDMVGQYTIDSDTKEEL
jgi:hypothetical protein